MQWFLRPKHRIGPSVGDMMQLVRVLYVKTVVGIPHAAFSGRLRYNCHGFVLIEFSGDVLSFQIRACSLACHMKMSSRPSENDVSM